MWALLVLERMARIAVRKRWRDAIAEMMSFVLGFLSGFSVVWAVEPRLGRV